ncbi:MAG: heavy metal translocating P-type ATPase [Peptoniphilaceae bacterium]
MDNINEKCVFYLKGLNCINCAEKIRNKTEKIAGVEDADIDLASQKLSLSLSKSLDKDKLLKDIQAIINSIEDDVEITENKEVISSGFNFKKHKNEILKLLFVFIGLLIVSLVKLDENIKLLLFVILYLIVGKDVLISAGKNILKLEVFDENFLMSIASLGAFVIGEYPEAVAVMLFYEVGELFQDIAIDNSRKSIKEALNLKADYANLKIGNNTVRKDPSNINIGDIIIVRPGEKVPLDGTITRGKSSVNTANISGESLPRFLEEGDQIISGYINLDSVLEIKVDKNFQDTTVAKILDLVENASSRKSNTEKWITKFSKIYTPIVVMLAVLILFLGPTLFSIGFKDALFRACIFLVISCPCALVLSVPLGVFAGIGSASKAAVFVKGGNYLESLSGIKHIVFDKTGTLTKGYFEVESTIPKKDNFPEKDLIKLAYLGEKNSNHPIAKAIVRYVEDKSLNFIEEISDFKEIPGKGISYKLGDDIVLLGNKSLLLENNIDFNEELSTNLNLYVARGEELVGNILLNDSLKENTQDTIEELKKLNIGISILSGDTEKNVENIANKIGVNNFYASLLPQNKIEKLEDIMKKSHGTVAFVGDGVNDAPVLARADIGIAMGKLGSDSAIEASDIVLMTDNIYKIIKAIKISKNTKKIVSQNIIFALGIKVLVLILGSLGMVSMWLAVFADVGVTIIAVLNSIRALRFE